ncbi:MAG TPA: M23 family metallopeptidase [Clostridiales bacterium]|nr:M23 family metallopeptidase [Clostridiales bacterium]
MDEKQPVVIQGRPINRERPRERAEFTHYTRLGSSRVQSGSGRYGLSALREAGSSTGQERMRIRTGTAGIEGLRTRIRSAAGRIGTAAGPRPRRHNSEKELPNGNLMIKIAISVIIAFAVFLLNSIKLPLAQSLVDHVRTAITHEFDLEEALGKLKFVGDILPDKVKAVFGYNTGQSEDEEDEIPTFASPVRGEVVRRFGEKVVQEGSNKAFTNQGIDVKTAEGASIYAAADGVVAAVEKHELYGQSIWLDHGNRVFTFYGRCGQIDVKPGQRVRTGYKMGTVDQSNEGESVLHFQVWINDKPEDPLSVIKTGKDTEGQGV